MRSRECVLFIMISMGGEVERKKKRKQEIKKGDANGETDDKGRQSEIEEEQTSREN